MAFSKMIIKQRKRMINGAVTLIMTLVLMILSTLIIIFAANYGNLQSKAITNIQRHQQAYEAAQAGLEYGINYLQQNSATILASPVSGYILPYTNNSITNVTMANNSKFSITYTNPTANNYDLIKITSVGTSDDGTSTKTVSQLVEFGSLLLSAPTIPMTIKGDVSLSGDVEIINTYNNYTIKSGGMITLDKKAITVLSSGTSSKKKKLNGDVTENDAALAASSSSDIFVSYFGLPESIVKGSTGTYLTNNSDTNYSAQLDGLQGVAIWIDQTAGTATITGNTTIGSSTNPVVLIIKGTPSISGSTIIYGFVYVDNPLLLNISGDVLVVGAIVATGGIDIVGNSHVMYSPLVLQNIQNQNSMKYFAKVPGSWKDF